MFISAHGTHPGDVNNLPIIRHVNNLTLAGSHWGSLQETILHYILCVAYTGLTNTGLANTGLADTELAYSRLS